VRTRTSTTCSRSWLAGRRCASMSLRPLEHRFHRKTHK
jgi:hypothetical protein